MVTRVRKVAGTVVVKRKYSGFSLEEALGLVPTELLIPWNIGSAPLPPSAILTEILARFESFDLTGSEPAKIMLIDAILIEVVPRHPKIKVWKGEPLETDAMTGFTDYLIAPKRAYVKAPLLCVVEAKKDDFEGSEAQCVAEMVACRWNNRQSGTIIPIYGIVSNGNGWQFYCLTTQNTVQQSALFGLNNLSDLLGAVDYLCAGCAKHAP